MKIERIISVDYQEIIPREKVLDEVNELVKSLPCPNCGQGIELTFMTDWKQMPIVTECGCGYSLTARIHGGWQADKYYSVKMLASPVDPDGFVPVDFKIRLWNYETSNEGPVFLTCKYLATVRSDELSLTLQGKKVSTKMVASLWKSRDWGYICDYQARLLWDQGRRRLDEHYFSRRAAEYFLELVHEKNCNARFHRYSVEDVHFKEGLLTKLVKAAAEKDDDLALALKVVATSWATTSLQR